jgi:hypothetical protein
MEQAMSLIKAVDVPKYMADKMRSRRAGAGLSGSAAKPVAVEAEPSKVSPAAKESTAT